MVGIRKQAMSRSNLQQKNTNTNFIACELLVQRVDTFGVVLYRIQRPVNFTLHFIELQIGSSIKYKNTLFGNYFLKCNNIVKLIQLFSEYR